MEAKNLILGLQHLGLPTNCYEETLKFYQLLGFGVQTQEDNRGKRVCFLKLQDMVLEVYESEDCTLQTGAWDHIAINVNDVEATFRFITSTMSIENVTIQTLPFSKKVYASSRLRVQMENVWNSISIYNREKNCV